MTFSNVVKLLKGAKTVRVSWDGTAHDLSLSDQIILNTFGDLLVNSIYAISEDVFEIEIAVRPVHASDL